MGASVGDPAKFWSESFDRLWLFHPWGHRPEAEVVKRRAPHIPEAERLEILSLVHRYANKAGVDPQLVLAIMEVESNFDRYALSVANARGLMQIMPFWKKEIGHPDDSLFDMETNIRYGCYILKLYIDKEKNNLTYALGRYNGSRGRAKYPNKVYAALRKRWAL